MTDQSTEATQWMGDNNPTPLNPSQVYVPKDSPTIQILGSLQELSAALGMGRAHLAASQLNDFDAMLRNVQKHLYIIKADIAAQSEEPIIDGKKVPRISADLVVEIDGYVATLEDQLGIKPDRFILEAGSTSATTLFYANEVTRRTERLLVSLMSGETLSATLAPKVTKVQQYLNHLSYQLYLMARVSNKRLGMGEESIITNAETGEVTVQLPTDS